MASPGRARGTLPPGMGFREFIALVAMLMGVNALGIDAMLPALPDMGHALGIAYDNQRQWIIAAYVMGFGAAQLIYGPLADRFGRKPVMMVSLTLFVLTSVGAALAYDFETIVIARVLQGIAAAASRVLAVSIVRDCFSGRQMARVMSLTMIVFLAVPIIAPSVGKLILLVAPWEWIFLFLAGYGMLLLLWGTLRLPETQDPADRRPISVRAIGEGMRFTLTNRMSLGYTIASTCLFGSLLGFINSAQQIFADVFAAEDIFTLIFAAVAAFMAVASYTNSRIVERFGTRKVSHLALIGFITVSAIHSLVALSGLETIWTFSLLQAVTMACFGLAGSNFGSMAMEPVGHLAGTASSVQGFVSTLGGAAFGLAIGQSFDGTTVPVAVGYLLLGLAALGVVLITERGKLFRPQNAPVER